MKKLFYSMMPTLAFAFTVTICDVATAWAQTTKWVDQLNGSDSNDGNTEAAAYASLQAAITNSRSGNVITRSIIYVKNGAYAATGLVNPGGANTAILIQNLDYLTIQAVAGHNPVVKPVAAGAVSISIANCQHLIVDGIVSDQTVTQADHWQVFGSNNLTVRNCAFDGGQRGINFSSTLNTVMVEKCVFKNISLLGTSDALEFLNASYSEVTIQDNTFLNNKRHIRLHEQTGNTIGNFTIRRNLMNNALGEESVRLIGAADVVIENNVVMNSGQQGLYIDTGCSNISVRHNSFFKSGLEMIRTRVTSPDILIENNIFCGNGTHAAFGAAVSPLPGEDYNLIFNVGSATETSAQPAVLAFGANTKTGQDPLFVSTVAGSEDLRLQNNSPAIGAGIDLGVADDLANSARPQPVSSRPDLGAHEHSRATPDNGGGTNPTKIMPIGDSITQMYPDHNSYRRPLWHLLQNGGFNVDFVGSQNLNKNGPPPNPDFDMDHEGHSSWRADDVLAQIENLANAFQPDIALIHLGSNDVFEYQSNSSTISELGQIIDKLRLANPNIKILLAQIIPSIYEANAIVDLNQRIPNLAASRNTQQSPVIVVDHWTGFSVSQDMYDGVHPNDAGDQKIADRWHAALAGLLNNVPLPTAKWVDQINGSDSNNGNTEATAYASLQAAINNSQSGTAAARSTIHVKNGAYGANGLANPGGANTAILIQNLDYLTIQAVAGHNPMVKPIAAGTISIAVANCNHLIIDGIASDQTLAQSDNWQVFGSNNLTVRNCSFDGGQRGIKFSTTLNAVLVEKNTFKNISALSTSDGLEFLQASYSEVIIQDNIFLNNKRHIRLHEQAGNTISNFIIRRNFMNGTSGEESLRLIGASEVVLENNVVMAGAQQGLYIDSGCSNITIRHNSFYKNGFEGIRTRANSPDIAIKNNIFYGNGMHAALAASVSPLPGEDYNLIFNAGLTTETSTQPAVTLFGASTMIGQDPLFVSVVAGSEDLHLQNSSPAIAAGVDLGVTDDIDRNTRPRPASTRPDLGAYEIEGAIVVPDIAVNPGPHNYGDVTVGSNATQTFEVSNAGAANLEVSAISLAGANPGQFSLASGGTPFALGPGASRNIVVNFKPTSVGAKSATLSLASNDPDENPLTVALSGNGVAAPTPDIAMNPTVHNFGDVTVGSNATQTFAVSNAGAANLEVSAISLAGANPGQFSLAGGGTPFALGPGASRNIVVNFKPTSASAKSANLNLTCNDPDENPLTVALSGNGVAAPVPDIAMDLTSHDYGDVTVGSNATQTFVVSNAGAANLEVSAISLTGSSPRHFSIVSGGAPFTLAPGANRNIVVSFKPLSLGAKSATLSLASSDPDENPLTVALSGNGVAAPVPDIAVNPSAHNYGDVTIGSNATQTFVVSNMGKANLEVHAIKLVGANNGAGDTGHDGDDDDDDDEDDDEDDGGDDGHNAKEFSFISGGAPFALSPGSSHHIAVRFKPTSAGAKSASLSLTCNDPDENSFAVALSGNGISESPRTYLFLAEKKVEIKSQLSSDGNIHSNDEIKIEDGHPSIHKGNLTALGKIAIKNYNTINGDVAAGGELQAEYNVVINGTATGYAPVAWVSLPNLSFSAGGKNEKVGKNRSRNLAPGSYGEAKVDRDATLFLRHDGSSGEYFFKKLEMKDRAVLSVDVTKGPVTINIVEKLEFKKSANVQITPRGDAGSAWLTLNSLADVICDEDARVLGSIIAPYNNVELKKYVSFKGLICAKEIKAEENTTLLYHASGGALTKEVIHEDDAGSGIERASAATQLGLGQNYPNPFNPSTTITFTLPEPSEVSLRIYNLGGQLVKTLVSGNAAAGRHQVVWDGTDAGGQQVASGIYYCRMQAGNFFQVKKMLLVR